MPPYVRWRRATKRRARRQLKRIAANIFPQPNAGIVLRRAEVVGFHEAIADTAGVVRQ